MSFFAQTTHDFLGACRSDLVFTISSRHQYLNYLLRSLPPLHKDGRTILRGLPTWPLSKDSLQRLCDPNAVNMAADSSKGTLIDCLTMELQLLPKSCTPGPSWPTSDEDSLARRGRTRFQSRSSALRELRFHVWCQHIASSGGRKAPVIRLQ